MQHLEDGFLHALADGEIPSEELTAVREHLEQCTECRGRLDEARMEAETARELIEFIEVPALALDGTTEGRNDGTNRPAVQPPSRGGWMRTLAWAATLVLAAGVGYYGRGAAPFARPAAEPMSLGRIDTVFLDVPAEVGQTRENETNRNAGLERAARPVERQAQAPAPAQAAPPARSDEAAARQEKDDASKQKVADPVRLEEIVLKGADSAPSAQSKRSPSDKKEAEDKLSEGYRQRAANDSRDQAASNLARKAAAEPATPPAALAEERLMAKSAADAGAVAVTFPRAVELLGGRIKLIEGMVPARLEAVGRMVRVVYVIDEGDLVLSQVGARDSLSWSLSGPLSADSLGRLRLKVR